MSHLSLFAQKSTTNVDLTALGATDWIFVFSDIDIIRKSGGGSLIAVAIANIPGVDPPSTGEGPAGYSDSERLIAWSDGTPTNSNSGTAFGVYSYGEFGGAFSTTFPADTNLRKAVVYVGAYNATTKILATLSDASAGPISDTTSLLRVEDENICGFVEVYYQAASSGQTLTVTTYTDLADGNTTFQAAACWAVFDVTPPTFIQAGFRFYADDGGET